MESVRLPQPAKDLILSGTCGHLATIDGDGSPYVTLAWTGIEDEEIVIATLVDQRKLRNMRRIPTVSISFEGDKKNEFGLQEHLIVRGEATVTEGGAPELLQELAYVYLGPGVKFPPMPDPPPGFVTRIRVHEVRGVGPWADG